MNHEEYEVVSEAQEAIKEINKNRANAIARILKDYDIDNPCSRTELCEMTNLSPGQLSSAIKYMRRCSEEDIEKFIRFYPISSKKGYFFPHKWSDFSAYYVTMLRWSRSLERTIKPCLEKMMKEGVNFDEIMNEQDDSADNYLHDPSIDKDSAWFFDN